MTTKQKQINANELKSRCEGHWVEILSAICPDLEDAVTHPRKHYPCPVHGGKHGDGLRALPRVADTGATVCNTCGKHPDGFSTIMWRNGVSFREALEAVDAYWGGLSYTSTQLPAVKVKLERSAEEDEKLRASLKKLWASCVPLTHPSAKPARMYFLRRGIPLPHDKVRFHPGLYYKTEGGKQLGRFPGFVAIIEDSKNQPVTLHRNFITNDGRKLSEAHAEVEDNRKMMGIPNGKALAGAAIRRTSLNNHEMGVAEGLETAAAAEVLFNVPTWSCVNSWMLSEWCPPEGITSVHIFADKDHSGGGQAAADALAARLSAMGIEARIHLPDLPIPEGKKSVDWNDVLLHRIHSKAA